MTLDIKVPHLAESISDAVLVEWLKQDGDAVRADEPIATLETDKAAVEIAASDAGVLRHARKAGERVEVGDVIAHIEAGAEAAASKPASKPDAKPKGAAPGGTTHAPPRPVAMPARPSTPGPTPAPSPADVDEPHLSPAVRRLIEEHGLDPAAIGGTGRGGRILKEDVLRHLERVATAGPTETPAPPDRVTLGGAETPAAIPPRPPVPRPAMSPASAPPTWSGDEEERAVPMSRIRQRIAERLVRAQQTAAILTTFNEVDMGGVLELRARYKDSFEKRHGVRLGFMSFFSRACVLALGEVPELNAEIRDTDIVYRRHVHMGIAVGTPRGLVVPVIRNADQLDFAGIERELNRLAERARDGTLSLDELSGGTFTISNGGVYGSLLSTPILNPPQSGILGMHKIEKRPIALSDQVVIRPMMYLALSYDHRIVDGEQAVTFLVRVKERLEDPERMLLDV